MSTDWGTDTRVALDMVCMEMVSIQRNLRHRRSGNSRGTTPI